MRSEKSDLLSTRDQSFYSILPNLCDPGRDLLRFCWFLIQVEIPIQDLIGTQSNLGQNQYAKPDPDYSSSTLVPISGFLIVLLGTDSRCHLLRLRAVPYTIMASDIDDYFSRVDLLATRPAYVQLAFISHLLMPITVVSSNLLAMSASSKLGFDHLQ